MKTPQLSQSEHLEMVNLTTPSVGMSKVLVNRVYLSHFLHMIYQYLRSNKLSLQYDQAG